MESSSIQNRIKKRRRITRRLLINETRLLCLIGNEVSCVQGKPNWIEETRDALPFHKLYPMSDPALVNRYLLAIEHHDRVLDKLERHTSRERRIPLQTSVGSTSTTHARAVAVGGKLLSSNQSRIQGSDKNRTIH
jgi:hypothetical protein